MQKRKESVGSYLTNEEIKRPHENAFMLVNHCIEKARVRMERGESTEQLHENLARCVLEDVLQEQSEGHVWVHATPPESGPRLVEPSDIIAEEVLAQAGYSPSSKSE